MHTRLACVDPIVAVTRRGGIAIVLASFCLLATATITGCARSADAAENARGVPVRTVTENVDGQEIAILTDAPNVPPPITRTHATRVIVNLEVIEKTVQIADSI